MIVQTNYIRCKMSKYTTFSKKNNNQLKEPMFFGQPVNVARYDQQKYPLFEKLVERQLSFYWNAAEIDVSKDRMDYMSLTDAEKHIFISNLKYQILLDSVQGRSPNAVLLPIVSLPELESWIEVWSAFEVIHSRSYTHIIRNIVSDPSVIFDDIMENEHIMKRAESVTKYYDDLYNSTQKYQCLGSKSGITLRDLKKKLYLCMMAVNVLEAVRFYVSFACSFAFAETKRMEGNAKIIGLISRDEALHMSGTQNILKIFASGDDDPEMKEIADECFLESLQIFQDASNQEKEWAKYLFKDGSMLGLNEKILSQYVEYITNSRMRALGLPSLFPDAKVNPIPWINSRLSSDNVQVAPQESEITSYLVGQIDSDLSDNDFDDFDL